MKGGAQAALALGVGYILGRRRKMRLATMLALGAATGGIGGLGPAALRRGGKDPRSKGMAKPPGPPRGENVSPPRGGLVGAAEGRHPAGLRRPVGSLSGNPR